MASKQNKIASNLQQDYTEAEKAQARQNIGLATVAHTGDFNDLINRPPVVTGQAQADWDQTNETAADYIKNKPVIPTPPQVNDAVLTIQKNGSTVQTFTANSSTNKTANIEVPTKVSELDNDADYLTSQTQSNWTQSNTSAVDYIRNKRAFKTFVTSYDYPDCVHVRNPGANTSVLVYYPYEDRKKLLFVDGRVYNLRIITSGIQPQDDTIEAITARLFVVDTNRERKYLCPPYTFKTGNSVQFTLNWQASGVLSVSEALLDECAPHIEFNCNLKANTDVSIWCNGLEWFLNENVAI